MLCVHCSYRKLGAVHPKVLLPSVCVCLRVVPPVQKLAVGIRRLLTRASALHRRSYSSSSSSSSSSSGCKHVSVALHKLVTALLLVHTVCVPVLALPADICLETVFSSKRFFFSTCSSKRRAAVEGPLRHASVSRSFSFLY